MPGLEKSETYQNLRPADRVTALSALKDAIDAEIKRQKAIALSLAEQVGVKSFTTAFGALNVVQKDAPILINEFKLLDWVKEKHPENIEKVEQVMPWYVRQLSDPAQYAIIDGVVFDAKGNQVEYAEVGETPGAYISWPASKEQKAGKALAADFVSGHMSVLAGGALGLTEVAAVDDAGTPQS